MLRARGYINHEKIAAVLVILSNTDSIIMETTVLLDSRMTV